MLKKDVYKRQGLKKEKLPDFVKEKITELGIIQSSMQVDAPVTKEETVYTDDEEDVVDVYKRQEYRIPPAECLKKMKLFYWKETVRGREKMEIKLNHRVVAAVISLRINGCLLYTSVFRAEVYMELMPII